VINLSTVSSGQSPSLIVGAKRGAELAENRLQERSGAVSGRCRKRRSGSEARGGERGAGVTEIGCSVERLFRRLRSARMLCWSHTFSGAASSTGSLSLTRWRMRCECCCCCCLCLLGLYKYNRSLGTLSTLRNAGVEQHDVFDVGG